MYDNGPDEDPGAEANGLEPNANKPAPIFNHKPGADPNDPGAPDNIKPDNKPDVTWIIYICTWTESVFGSATRVGMLHRNPAWVPALGKRHVLTSVGTSAGFLCNMLTLESQQGGLILSHKSTLEAILGSLAGELADALTNAFAYNGNNILDT
ncbi:hypothetical protein FRC07_005560 [Ceratobasidium sp. 392]|nr:hypothetical protein FRC07_005560 [Ceratobasidium sp. 392]